VVRSSAASDVYKRQVLTPVRKHGNRKIRGLGKMKR
jgi:hypothetical protein